MNIDFCLGWTFIKTGTESTMNGHRTEGESIRLITMYFELSENKQ